MEIYFIIVGITIFISCSMSNSLRPLGLFIVQSFPVILFLIALSSDIDAEFSFILFFVCYMISVFMIKNIIGDR